MKTDSTSSAHPSGVISFEAQEDRRLWDRVVNSEPGSSRIRLWVTLLPKIRNATFQQENRSVPPTVASGNRPPGWVSRLRDLFTIARMKGTSYDLHCINHSAPIY